MISFGYVYVEGEMVIYDVTLEETANYTTYVAALSADPTVSFRAVRAQTAITRLLDHLAESRRPAAKKVAWLPTRPAAPATALVPWRRAASL